MNMKKERMRSVVLIVEVVRKCGSLADEKVLSDATRAYLGKHCSSVRESVVLHNFGDDVLMNDNISQVRIRRKEGLKTEVELKDAELQFRVFLLWEGSETDYIADGDDDTSASQMWSLPNKDFDNLWDSLIFDNSVKDDLLRFVEAIMRLSEKKVDPSLAACNRMLLLHGPPGTGKTTLCKALAHRFSILFKPKYPKAQLLEVNSHSLFSRFFSESGKLVMKLFGSIREIVEGIPDCLVFVLIDEVESLAHCRVASFSASEPSDGVRTVNALLTQIDQLARFPNVMFLCTSNITDAIDAAFTDRADIIKYIGLPSTSAVYQIFASAINELITKEIIETENNQLLEQFPGSSEASCLKSTESKLLYDVSRLCHGVSGRMLRKLPLLALARTEDISERHSMQDFIRCLEEAVRAVLKEKSVLGDKRKWTENGKEEPLSKK